MIIYPAIDLKNGQCVRLTKGDYDRMTVYEADPVKVARRWEAEGAQVLHLVDLDGARGGERVNEPVVRRILEAVSIPVQLGGGIRDTAAVETFLQVGVDRVIIGTAALTNPDWIRDMFRQYGQRIIVSIDAVGGLVAVDGWETVSRIRAVDLVRELEGAGLRRVVYTDIEKDGMLAGPNFAMYEELQKLSTVEIIASGGITTLSDVRRLREMELYGAIIGKSLYNGNLTLKEVLSC